MEKFLKFSKEENKIGIPKIDNRGKNYGRRTGKENAHGWEI